MTEPGDVQGGKQQASRWLARLVCPDRGHVYPTDDLIDHVLDEDGDCVCGPDQQRNTVTFHDDDGDTSEGDMWWYLHHALRGGRPPDGSYEIHGP